MILVADRLHQQALLRVSRHQCNAGIAPFERRLAGVQGEAALYFLLRAVTIIATRHQQGADLFFKKLHPRSPSGSRA